MDRIALLKSVMCEQAAQDLLGLTIAGVLRLACSMVHAMTRRCGGASIDMRMMSGFQWGNNTKVGAEMVMICKFL